MAIKICSNGHRYDSNNHISCPQCQKILDISNKYDKISQSKFKIYTVIKDNKWGIINNKIEEVFPLNYDYVDPIASGILKVQKGNKCGLINDRGEEIVPLIYDRLYPHENYGLSNIILVNKGNKWGFINEIGEEIVPTIFDEAGISDIYTDDDFPEYYADDTRRCLKSFCNGLARVCLNGKWGFVNYQGQLIIPCEYDYSDPYGFFTGLAVVRKGSSCFMINRAGEEIYRCLPIN